MARITVEDCLQVEDNRFALVQLASKRTKQLLSGSPMLVDSRKGNKPVVSSLREIAAGLVRFKTAEDIRREKEEEESRRSQAMELLGEESDSNDNVFENKNGSRSNGSHGLEEE